MSPSFTSNIRCDSIENFCFTKSSKLQVFWNFQVDVNDLPEDLNWDVKLLEKPIYDIYTTEKKMNWVAKTFHNLPMLRKELLTLYKLNHISGIPKVLVGCLNKKFGYVIMSRADGHDLYHYNTIGRMDEEEAKHIIRELLYILRDVHKEGVIHKDIKLENVMYNQEDGTVTLVDFEGRSTPDYHSPEIIKYEDFGTWSDMWAIGMLTFILVEGYFPFESRSEILHNKVVFQYKHSKELKRFVSKLLRKSKKQRATLEEALEDPWLQ